MYINKRYGIISRFPRRHGARNNKRKARLEIFHLQLRNLRNPEGRVEPATAGNGLFLSLSPGSANSGTSTGINAQSIELGNKIIYGTELTINRGKTNISHLIEIAEEA